MPRYGRLNVDYLGSWSERDDPGGPMWALNLMRYRERADYADGRETDLTGAEADDLYLQVRPPRRLPLLERTNRRRFSRPLVAVRLWRPSLG